jgi:hypothetical protein
LEPAELSRGLWRWSAPHPEWKPGAPESAHDWPREVSCVLFQTSASALFIDPLLPADGKTFWQWADDCCRGRAVAVLTTVGFHSRSRDAVIERYGAASYGPDADAETEQILPGGVQTFAIAPLGETVVWISSQRTLVIGDALVGVAGGGLRVCPDSWLDYAPEPITPVELRDYLRPLLELPVERVLVAHGEPVLERGHAALEQALEPDVAFRRAS